MTQRILLEIAVILVLLAANGLFAMSEIAVVTARRARLQRMAAGGSRRAVIALRLAEQPDRFLSTVQIGITTIGIFAGAFGGATLASELDGWLETMPLFSRWSEVLSIGIVVLVITYLSLVIGELVPKRIALLAPERVAVLIAPFMNGLAKVAAPAVRILAVSTRAMLALFRVRDVKDMGVTEDELRLMLIQGSRAGTIDERERVILDRVFRLGDRPLRTIMTPRTELEWLDLDRPLEELRAQVSASSHTRFPAGRGSVDRIESVVHASDLWAGTIPPREPLFVPEQATGIELIDRFRETGNHLAVVIDEYGGTEGVVTPTDILEALVGELPEEGDAREPSVLQRADGTWSVDATVDAADVAALLGLAELPGQKESYQTIAGYFVDRLGKAARLGDQLDVEGIHFEVLDVDGRRIDRVLVTRNIEDLTSSRA